MEMPSDFGEPFSRVFREYGGAVATPRLKERHRCRPDTRLQTRPLVTTQTFLMPSQARLFLGLVRARFGLRFFLLPVVADDTFQGADRECRTFLAAD
jgi:hypothetical protein